jgi:transcriptional regulator with GAF, ATPase, and Fis domain
VLARALEEEEVLQNCEVDIVRPDGSVRTLLVTVHSLQDELGSALGVVAILKDQTELRALQTALNGQTRYERLVGKNHRMREIYQLISDIGDSDATVLILGESGTGKELVAEAIHKRSHRSEGPFVKVNCSALSEGLLESELFGHVKGAFTGAIRDKVGRFELADG